MDQEDHNSSKESMSQQQRGVLEPLSTTVEIPSQLETGRGRTYILADERHQRGRVGYRFHRGLVPVVTVGHSFAIDNGDWFSPDEYWGAFLTKPFKFRRSPENSTDKNAIMVTSLPTGKFLGFLSRELGSILSPLADEGACAIFGVAGHITVEIAEWAKVSEEAKAYLEWLEDFLLKYQGGKHPKDLPRCPVSLSDLK